MTRFYVGGELNEGSYLWLIEDNGSTLTRIGGVPVSVIPDVVDYLAAAPTLGGGLYVACDDKIYKVNRTSWLLDTTWATAGVYTAPSTIQYLAVDSSNYLAVACTANTVTANILLLNASGSLVWSRTYPGWCGGAGATNFRADNGNVLYGPFYSGLTPKVLELARSNGATVATRGDDGTVWAGVTACKYIPGLEPYWFIRTKIDEVQVASADVGTMTVDSFPTDTAWAFDVSSDLHTVILAGPDLAPLPE